MPLLYLKSKKGRDQLFYKGYLHTKERVFGNKTVWKCANYHKNRCPGRAHTRDDHVIKYTAHRHPPGKAAIDGKRMGCSARAAILCGSQQTHEVAPAPSGGLPETVPTKKPRIQNPKQTIQRLRACLSATRQGAFHSQTSAIVTKSIPKAPSSVLSVSPPNVHECSERFKDASFRSGFMLCEEPRTSGSVCLQASQEAGRQRFRSGIVPPGATPQEILSCISAAAQQWLCPQEHEKDEIMDMVILEQFLAVLPVSMQAWVKAREPRKSMEAVWLAESYLGDQELAGAGQELEKDLVIFEDVSVCFSEEEWALLDQREKALYWNIMHQNYDNVAWLSGGTSSQRGKDPWQEPSEPIVELVKKNNKDSTWGTKQDSNREAHQEKQPNSSSAVKEDVNLFISGLKEITRDAELGLETVLCCGCSKEDESSIVASRKSSREEDAEPTILSGELQEPSGKKNPQNPEENVIKEGHKDVERLQEKNLRVEDKLIPFRKDHQDGRPGQETLCMAVDGGDQDESLTLLQGQNIPIESDLGCVALPEGSLLISHKEIPQSPEKDSQPEPMHIDSLSELNRTSSGEGVNRTAALNSEKTIIVDTEKISSPGKEGREAKSVLSGNGLPELTEDLLPFPSQPTAEPWPTGPNPEESSEHNSSQKSSQGEDLPEDLSNKRQFIQSSPSTTQPTCSNSGGNPSSLSVLIKHRRFDKKRKPCSERNTPVRSVLGTHWRISPGGKRHKHLNWNRWASRKRGCRFPELQTDPRKHSSVNMNAQPHKTLQTAMEEHRTSSRAASSSHAREAKPWQRAPPSSLLDRMAAESVVAQVMEVLEQYWNSTGAVLKQVAADTEKIKSAVSRLDCRMTGIQNALGSTSGCAHDDAWHRISDLELTSQNTKAQLVQHCNEIKAIEAKLVGKAVQTNVIAGLWPLQGIKREMSP
ncbi:uncharacterized protein LOC143831614 isoform X2 [Paroedura picta]|uniref:uncharacterized protein LOC143831614 isoform X2 n=1 Tax=Paroedura picta TaxID=143630 RepID=UPI004057098E